MIGRHPFLVKEIWTRHFDSVSQSFASGLRILPQIVCFFCAKWLIFFIINSVRSTHNP